MEFATDWGFLSNRYLFSLAWYRHRSDNQILPDSFPKSGPPNTLHNRPVVLQNSGWELNLLAKNIDKKDFGWTTSLNFSFPVNKLLYFSNPSPSFYDNFVIGQSIHVLKGYKYLGVNPTTGLFQFRHQQGDTPTKADITTLGNLDITCFGGLQNNIRWHHWQLETNIEFRKQKGANYQAAIYQANPPGSFHTIYSNETTDILHRWQKPGDIAPYQKLTTKKSSPAAQAITNYLQSDGILTDASFARLKTITLSWDWPDRLLRKLGLQEGKLSLEGQNLFVLTPYKGTDPETQSILVLPPLKTIELHVQVKF
jgi:hypothetical protein